MHVIIELVGVILGLLLKNACSYTALEIWVQTFKALDYSDSGVSLTLVLLTSIRVVSS